ncbi:MAG: ACT domain-containing protein [Clostridia bacterium]|nr:ACT domain-containing protein [Clostridia bacterium]
MKLQQISIFMENKPGMLCEITKFIASKNVNLRALSVADAQDFGIVRLIVDDPGLVNDILTNEGYTTNKTYVLGVEIPDQPGKFSELLEKLAKENINIEYSYAFTSQEGKAISILRVDDVDKAEKILSK